MTDVITVDPDTGEILDEDSQPALLPVAWAAGSEMTLDELHEQMQRVRAAMDKEMDEGADYGTIPGAQKPSLWKPGAEKLLRLFKMRPVYQDERIFDGEHLTIFSQCKLYFIPSGDLEVGEGGAACSTKEKKYRERQATRVCPVCHRETIIQGKAEYGGGWLCWKKKGGCGAKFVDDDPRITSQEVGPIENPDLADLWNTVVKMAHKRALIAAVLDATAASEIFTQDVGEERELAPEKEPQPAPEPLPEQKSKPQPERKITGEQWEQIKALTRLAHAYDKDWTQKNILRRCQEEGWLGPEDKIGALATEHADEIIETLEQLLETYERGMVSDA